MGPVEDTRLHLLSSCISGICAQIVCHPIDTVKTLVMQRGGGGPSSPILELTSGRGGIGAIRRLYGGLLPALLSRGPMVMLFLPLTEQIRSRVFDLNYI